MKKSDLIKVLFFLIIGAGLTSCTSLSKTKLAEHPDFEKNAQSYLISHPYFQPLAISTTGYSSKNQTFIIENVKTKKVFKTEVLYVIEHEPEGLSEVLKRKTKFNTINSILDYFFAETDSMANEHVDKRRDFFYQALVIFNPINDINYLVLSKVFYLPEIYVNPSESNLDNSTVDISTISYPIEYWIFEEDKEIGFFSFDPSQIYLSGLILVYGFDIFINDKLLYSEFQGLDYKRRVSWNYEDQLLAFFDLKPPKLVSKGMHKDLIGKVMIKKDLSKEFTAEIFTAYIIADMAFNYLKRDPFSMLDKEF